MSVLFFKNVNNPLQDTFFRNTIIYIERIYVQENVTDLIKSCIN